MNIGRFSLRPTQALMLVMSLQLTSTALAQDDEYINPDRPGIADGSKVIGAGRVQIETGVQKEFRRGGLASDQTAFVPTLFRVGINNRWEVRVESNTYTMQRTADPENGVTRSQGIAPVSIGTKYQFLEANKASQPSLGVIVRVFPASGSRDFRSQHATGDVRLAADWDFAEQWSFNPNVGVAAYEDGQNRRFNTELLAVTLSYNPSKALSLFVDTGMQSREEKNGKSAAVFDAGVAYLPMRDVQLDFSVGGRTHGATPPRVFVSLGVSKMF
ncbi:transporter [Undibacterium sp. Jales W-56]|uniref:transporter n=1 Tax=Undibacterium sp. Jales W-56 TaxID=2897325 RepID=UPI0021D1B184|nr:transporter [Undibacterium sp. Jales W-56]MCU6435306.1 transporter [Undibacterium sp. Jales W-56]